MARLSKEQWETIRATWESDEREGFDWLANELGNIVSRQAISKMAAKQGWGKGGQKVAQPKDKSCATKPKVAQPKPKPASQQKPIKSENQDQPEWEEVDEPPQKIHGNSMYLPSYDRQVYQLCLLGASDIEIAKFFNVAESTIYLWKKNYVTFSESMKAGKIDADARAAKSLFKRATGYQYTEVKKKEVVNENGELVLTEVVNVEKEMPPDTTAAFMWLKNRRPKDWRDKQEIEISGKIDQTLLERIQNDYMEKIEQARERQRQVLIERGIVIDQE